MCIRYSTAQTKATGKRGYMLADYTGELRSRSCTDSSFESSGNMVVACRAVTSLPNPIEYFAFVFCFTTFFAGPAFDFREYISGVEEKHFHHDGKVDRRWRKRILETVKKTVVAVVCLGLTTVGQAKFPFSSVYSYEVMHKFNPVHRYAWAWVCLFLTRVKYYFAWIFTEATANLAGFG